MDFLVSVFVVFLTKRQHPRNGVTSLPHCVHSSQPNPRLPEAIGDRSCSWNVDENCDPFSIKIQRSLAAWVGMCMDRHTHTHVYEYQLKASAMPWLGPQPGIFPVIDSSRWEALGPRLVPRPSDKQVSSRWDLAGRSTGPIAMVPGPLQPFK